MSESRSTPSSGFRWLASSFGVALLVYLVLRTGPQVLWKQIEAVGYGIVIIFCVGGLAHLIKTLAWRRTFTCDISRLSMGRSFALRLVSEAIGQLGIAGKVVGEGARVSLLGDVVPTANAISAAALDSVLYIITSMIVAITAILASFLVAPLSGKLRIYALLFTAVFAIVLIALFVAVGRGSRALAGIFKVIGRLPGCKDWISRKQQLIDATEQNLLYFHREAPANFRAAILLNFCAHVLAVTEIYIVLRFLTPKATLIGAFVLEGMTKFINFVGAINPGNVGTYEGGNMLIGKLFGLSATAGLTLALCRRARALCWSAIGAVCLVIMRRPTKDKETEAMQDTARHERSESDGTMSTIQKQDCSTTVILLADWEKASDNFSPSLAPVATVPLLLRNILSVRATHPDRVIIAVPSNSAEHIKSLLARTGRMPSVEWKEVNDSDLVPLIADASLNSRKIVLVQGSRSYRPPVLQDSIGWESLNCLGLATDNELAGVYVLSQSAALSLAESGVRIETLEQLHLWLQRIEVLEVKEVPSESWHAVSSPEDLRPAERKIENWLTKPTDGIFARMNRRVSIPISRQLIEFPVTPNMVSLFVLGVSISCGAFYARGGYWGCLIAALLSVAGSILDGCDGEVARFKLMSTPFGCWLDTICDYLYYIAAFTGMAFGLSRSSGNRIYLVWGVALLLGAAATIVVVSFSRQRLSGSNPEKLLAVWQKKAESRSSNPLLYFGRQTEFIIRRCFHPYALVFFALLGATNVVFVGAAIGANIAWIIALYSFIDFSRTPNTHVSLKRATVVHGESS